MGSRADLHHPAVRSRHLLRRQEAPGLYLAGPGGAAEGGRTEETLGTPTRIHRHVGRLAEKFSHGGKSTAGERHRRLHFRSAATSSSGPTAASARCDVARRQPPTSHQSLDNGLYCDRTELFGSQRRGIDSFRSSSASSGPGTTLATAKPAASVGRASSQRAHRRRSCCAPR
jgi:hypothetical protein